MNDLVTFKLTKEAFSIIFNEGIPFDALKQILIKKFEESAKFFDGVKYKTILKGRNFTEEELDELKEVIKEKYPNIKTFVWTGYVLEELNINDLISIDVLIDGQFIEELRDRIKTNKMHY